MKFLAVLLFSGIVVASAIPLFSKTHDLEVQSLLEDDFSHLTFGAEGEHDLEYVKKQLKERFDELLHKIKDAVEQGKGLREDMMEKIHILREKLKNLNIDFSKKSKEIMERIKEKGKEYLKKLLERLGLDKTEIEEHSEGILADAEGDFDIEALKSKFQDLVKKLKDAFEQGKSLKDALEKLQHIKDKLKDLNIDLGEKGKEYLKLLKEKVKEYWNKLREKLSVKRHTDDELFGMLERLKEMVLQGVDEAGLRDFVLKIFGNGESNEFTEHFFGLLRDEDGRDRILEWLTRVLDDRETEYSISDIYHKIKEYFKELNIELKEKFVKFGEWVKEQYQKGLEKGKSKAENIKKIANQFLQDTRKIGKEVAQEALDFFQEYKNDLGNLYDDLVEKVNQILKS